MNRRGLASLVRGFTIVELLIVIVVIGIIAGLVINSLASAQERAKFASSQNDVRVISQAIKVARENTGQPLVQITGNDCTDCTCRNPGYLQMSNVNSLAQTTECWEDYKTAIAAIAVAANTNLDQLLKGNPWGAPYFIDENEEDPYLPCARDRVGSAGKDGNYDTITRPFAKTDPYDLWEELPSTQSAC